MFAAVHDFQAANDLLAEVHNHGFGHGYRQAALAEYWPCGAVPWFGDGDIRHVGAWLCLVRVEGRALVHSGAQILRQTLVQLLAGINEDSGVDIAPVLFQPRVHAGERVLHAASDNTSGREMLDRFSSGASREHDLHLGRFDRSV